MSRDWNDQCGKWDNLTIKERLALIEKWENEDKYPYGRSNAKKRVTQIRHHYLLNHIWGL